MSIAGVDPNTLSYLRGLGGSRSVGRLDLPLSTLPSAVRETLQKTVVSLADSLQKPNIVSTQSGLDGKSQLNFVQVNDKEKFYPIETTRITVKTAAGQVSAPAVRFYAPVKDVASGLKDDYAVILFKTGGRLNLMVKGDDGKTTEVQGDFDARREAEDAGRDLSSGQRAGRSCWACSGAPAASTPGTDGFASSSGPSLSAAVAQGTLKAVPSKAGGPPWGDTLLCAESWNGKPITSTTSDSTSSGPHLGLRRRRYGRQGQPDVGAGRASAR